MYRFYVTFADGSRKVYTADNERELELDLREYYPDGGYEIE